MKRSKIILGLTTALLAIAGITAAKRYTDVCMRWYVTVLHGNYCNGLLVPCTQSGTIQCLGFYTDGVIHTLVKIGSLYTKGSFDSQGKPRLANGIENCATICNYDPN